MPDDTDREPVTVIEEDQRPRASARSSTREPVRTRDLLAEIRAIPERVAAQVGGGKPASGKGAQGAEEVYFAPEPPAPSPSAEPDDVEVAPARPGAPAAYVPPEPKRSGGYRFPSGGRRRVETSL